jgi:hypothetical protein
MQTIFRHNVVLSIVGHVIQFMAFRAIKYGFIYLLSTDWYGFSLSIFMWLKVSKFVGMWSSVSVCGDAVRLLVGV